MSEKAPVRSLLIVVTMESTAKITMMLVRTLLSTETESGSQRRSDEGEGTRGFGRDGRDEQDGRDDDDRRRHRTRQHGSQSASALHRAHRRERAREERHGVIDLLLALDPRHDAVDDARDDELEHDAQQDRQHDVGERLEWREGEEGVDVLPQCFPVHGSSVFGRRCASPRLGA